MCLKLFNTEIWIGDPCNQVGGKIGLMMQDEGCNQIGFLCFISDLIADLFYISPLY